MWERIKMSSRVSAGFITRVDGALSLIIKKSFFNNGRSILLLKMLYQKDQLIIDYI